MDPPRSGIGIAIPVVSLRGCAVENENDYEYENEAEYDYEHEHEDARASDSTAPTTGQRCLACNLAATPLTKTRDIPPPFRYPGEPNRPVRRPSRDHSTRTRSGGGPMTLPRIAPTRSFLPLLAALMLGALPAGADAPEDTLAARRVTLDFGAAPLASVLGAFSTQAGVPIAIDPACAEVLAATGDRFTARVKDAPARAVLDGLLDGSGLTWHSDGMRIEVLSAARIDAEMITRSYAVGEDGDGIVRLLLRTEPTATWNRPAGFGLEHGTLWVSQTRAAQARIRTLVELLQGTPRRRVDFQGSLVEMPLERWRELAPSGARELRGDEADELLRESRNKGRLVREFSASAAEGREASFLTETVRPWTRAWHTELRQGIPVNVPEIERDAERLMCGLRPAVLDGENRVLVGVRCEFRRRESPEHATAAGILVELPVATERRISGTFSVRVGGAFAWRVGGPWAGEEPDRVLALIVRVAAVSDPWIVEGMLPAEADPRLARPLADPLRAASALEALGALAQASGIGLVHGPGVKEGTPGDAGLPVGAIPADAVRSLAGRLGSEGFVRGGVLCLRPAPADGGLTVVRVPGLAGASEDAVPFPPLAAAALSEDDGAVSAFRTEAEAPRAGGTSIPPWLAAREADAVLLPGGRLLLRRKAGTPDDLAPLLAESRRAAALITVVEAELLEVDGARLAEHGSAFGSGLPLDAHAAREWIEGADRRKGIERLAGWTWTASADRIGGATDVRDAAYLTPETGLGSVETSRLRTGLTVGVRVRPAGDGHQVDVEAEWAGTAGSMIGPDGAALATLPAVARTGARGGARIPDGGALAFALTPGTGAEQKALLLVVRVTRPGTAPEKK